MFTGIVEALGTVRSVRDRETTRRFEVEARSLVPELTPGDSVAVDGACLTVTDLTGTTFSVDVIGTTLERTVAGTYTPGSRVNLERAMTAGARFDGHLVQGHVDGVGHLKEILEDGEFWRLAVTLPADVLAGTVLHGSICLNGVSLTVSDFVGDDGVQIGIIPYTWEHTNLRSLEPGDPLNVEADLIGKYVGRLLAPHLPTRTD
jgi:riboflavin synthase